MKRTQAFTLVELAIVLVIIGLLVGGVLVGQELIKAATLRRQMAQVEKVLQAAVTFRLKYNCLPGDCVKATLFFGSATQPDRVTNGNGNGLIEHEVGANGCRYRWMSTVEEWPSVFDHLAAAHLYPIGQYDETAISNNIAGKGYPVCEYSGTGDSSGTPSVTPDGYQCGVILAADNRKHYIHLGAQANDPAQTYTSFQNAYRPAEASDLDRKYDDNVPITGRIQAMPRGGYMCSSASVAAAWLPWGSDLQLNPTYGVFNTCTNASGTAYGNNTVWRYCALRINAGF